MLTVVRTDDPVDDVVLGLVLQPAVVVEGPGGRPVHDVVLEEVLAGRHVAIEEVGAAVVRPPVPVGRKIINLGGLRPGSTYPYAIKNQRKARNAPSRGLWVP